MFLGAGEIVVVLAVALMVLGPRKMPEVARKLARFVSQARRITDEVRSQVDDALKEPELPKAPSMLQPSPAPAPVATAKDAHGHAHPQEAEADAQAGAEPSETASQAHNTAQDDSSICSSTQGAVRPPPTEAS